MSTNPLSEAFEPDFQSVFDSLTSTQCRTVLRTLDSPMTASEIADVCEMPRSTVYRKLEQMVDAGLLTKRDNGQSAAEYSLGFREVVVTHHAGGLELSVSSQSRSASDQLSELWAEVRTEATRDE
ncbi:helix-turn-helix domain-containing protein [Haloferax sp. MBLA0076]|uniref:Helix-turn-helix domain-containing protein n=1 Tax=Haloferax litoreum TaxID=2666140 RepID=A0A6A8GJZ9_9EURY|nr:MULTISPECIES: helix-turn-helix domain-containing protein [Haloferax]KAB1190613.1 helix-turn-helix transcriptional regulator [Haloferax sp. CBA1148]MRX23608.1 helix-turn-helix domain-containing protein [Haloferax litoreum]